MKQSMTAASNDFSSLERIPSGIAGLDRILYGGFFKGDSYLIVGPPGVGKTILGNQFCFHHVANGGRALYVTLLAETSSRMLAHLRSLTFFTPRPIGNTLSYLSGYSVLEQEGLRALMTLLRNEVRRQRATLLVIDGVLTAVHSAPSVISWMHFLHEIHVSAEFLGCTTILLAQPGRNATSHTEETMVDGVIELAPRLVDLRSIRELQVHKLRGSTFLEGKHLFVITNEGMTVHPRIEAVLAAPRDELHVTPSAVELLGRQSIGIAPLDEMLQGGLPSGSSTLLMGASGTGKTLLGCHFLLEGARQEQKGLYFGFHETPAQLLRTLTHFDPDAGRLMADESITVLWHPPVQDYLDLLAERLVDSIRRLGVRRLFLDGLNDFQRTVVSDERLDLFLAALSMFLRTQEITTIYSLDLPDLFIPTVEPPIALNGISALADNILFLRYVELHSQLYRLISILKMRESGYDSAIREFRITEQGIEVAPTFASAQDILTGIARPVSVPEAPPPFPTDPSAGKGEQP